MARRDLEAVMRSLLCLVVLVHVLAGPVHAAPRGDDGDDHGDAEAWEPVPPDVAADRIGAHVPDRVGGASPITLPAPPIGEVLAAAYAAAGFEGDPTRGWRRRARLAGLVPWVIVRTGWDANWKDTRPDVGRSRDLEVRATWRLDKLVFDGRELQVSSIDAARRRERRRLASQVIRAYFGWRRLAAAALREPRWSARAEEAAAELDALTDGWFSEQFEGPRRPASGFRTPGRSR